MFLRVAALAAIVLVSCPRALLAQSELDDDLTATRQQITAAETELAKYEGGLIKTLIQVRLETLRLTEALLHQRQLATTSGVTFQFQVPATQPNESRAQELLTDIVEAEKELARLEAEANSYAGGLTKALAESSVATQRQTVAMLKQAYYVAHYGLAMSTLPSESSSSAATADETASDSAAEPNGTLVTSTKVPYYISAFKAAGFEIVGLWSISRSKSEIDDSPVITASVPTRDADSSEMPKEWFLLACNEGEPRAAVMTDTYLLAYDDVVDAVYRFDELPAESDNWSVSTTSQAAGYWGKRAHPFIEKLRGKKKLAVQLTESRGQQHRYSFNLDGVDNVIEILAVECGWSGLLATKDEILKAQRLLKELNFYKGGADGQWGPGSRSALIEFQKSKGLQPTGLLDKLTKTALGI